MAVGGGGGHAYTPNFTVVYALPLVGMLLALLGWNYTIFGLVSQLHACWWKRGKQIYLAHFFGTHDRVRLECRQGIEIVMRILSFRLSGVFELDCRKGNRCCMNIKSLLPAKFPCCFSAPF